MLVVNRRHLQQVLAEYVDHSTLIGRTDHWTNGRLMAVPLTRYIHAAVLSDARIDSVASSTNITRSHEATLFSASTGSGDGELIELAQLGQPPS
jgi:hypothetical protein